MIGGIGVILLPAGTRDVAKSGGFRTHLPEQVHFNGVVDRHHPKQLKKQAVKNTAISTFTKLSLHGRKTDYKLPKPQGIGTTQP